MPILVAALLAGLAIGGVSTIGTAEWAYERGISAGWYNAAWAAGAVVMGLFAARRYRRWEITSLPEVFEFWQAGEYRLHDRFVYTKSAEGDWSIERLAP